MSRDRRKRERVRLLAELDQLRAENEALKVEVLARLAVRRLRATAAASGCCPVCRGPVPTGEAHGGRG